MPVETQLCLSEELFERYEVEGVRFSVSGGCELAADTVGLVAGEGLEPGMDVVIVCRGHVRDVSAPYRLKDKRHSGRVVLAVEIVERVTEVTRA